SRSYKEIDEIADKQNTQIRSREYRWQNQRI
ncbi:MAG: hypothetical protein ACI9SC_002001, partial [Gammaproteobacteria bacterium]